MTKDGDQPPPDLYFSKAVNFLDSHITIVQYSIYAVGLGGLFYCLHSIRAFSRFRSIEDIPKDFITKHMRLHGVVVYVSRTPLLHYYIAPSSRPYQCINDRQLSDTVALTNSRPMQDQSTPLYLQVQHSPILNSKWKVKNYSDEGSLVIKVAAIKVKENEFSKVHRDLLDKRIWFTILNHNTRDNALTCIVKVPKISWRSYNSWLVRNGLAQVEGLDPSLDRMKQYVNLHKRLKRLEEKLKKKPSRLWDLTRKIFSWIFKRSDETQ